MLRIAAHGIASVLFRFAAPCPGDDDVVTEDGHDYGGVDVGGDDGCDHDDDVLDDGD